MDIADQFSKSVIKDMFPDQGIEKAIKHLCRIGIINKEQIRQYLICKDFDKMYSEEKKEGIMEIYHFLSIKYDVHPSTVRRIVSSKRLLRAA